MSEEKDIGLFRASLGDVRPITSDTGIFHKQLLPHTPGIINRRKAAQAESVITQDGLSSKDYVVAVKPHDILCFKREGVQHGVFKKLRLGKYPVDSGIDLHHLTFQEARQQIAIFVAECRAAEIRCVLITHGKGENRTPPALLKSSVNHWLQQIDAVLAFHSAQPRHGGSGSTYVLFRKGAAKKAANRERFGLRG